jgi:hypothetical protein
LKKSLEERFKAPELLKWQEAATVWTRAQALDEGTDSYVSSMLKLAKRVPIASDDSQLLYAVMKGLRPAIRAYVMQQKCKTIDELLIAARIAELSSSPMDAAISALADQVREEQQRNRDELRDIAKQMQSLTVQTIDNNTTGNRSRSPTPGRNFNRRVRFQSPSSGSATSTPTQQRRQLGPRKAKPNRTWNLRQETSQTFQSCGQCGKPRFPNHRCAAINVVCFNCGKRGHLSAVCRTGRRSQMGNRP